VRGKIWADISILKYKLMTLSERLVFTREPSVGSLKKLRDFLFRIGA
jgi:hypothetical protein